MLEFENLAYIDLQKTGSTTISGVLREMIPDKKRRKRVHSPVPRRFDQEKLTFVSIREPLSLCISLFSFGAAEKKGQLYGTLMRKGYPGLYEPNVKGFERWLDFFTDPMRADALDCNFARYPVHNDIGLLAFRLLYMSIPNARSALKVLDRGRREVRRLLKRERVYSDYVRTENLAPDLFALFKRHESRLQFKHPLTTAEDLIARVPKKNASTKIEGVDARKVSAELRARVLDREWLIYNEFGYRDNPMGLPSDQNPRLTLQRDALLSIRS